MGEMADAMYEAGMGEWLAHIRNHCWEDCRYCEEEGEKNDNTATT